MDYKFNLSLRWVDTEIDRPRWRGTLNYRVHRRLQLGVEFNPAADEIGPLMTLFLLTEGEKRPGLFLGTSSDRIGSPAGKQSYYATLTKRHPTLPISAYVSLNYSEWDAAFNIPFGVEFELGERFTLRPMYDGDRTHLTLNYASERMGVSLLWVWLERFGIAFSARF